eukprot:766904-Hanusia_phi.AAC.1
MTQDLAFLTDRVRWLYPTLPLCCLQYITSANSETSTKIKMTSQSYHGVFSRLNANFRCLFVHRYPACRDYPASTYTQLIIGRLQVFRYDDARMGTLARLSATQEQLGASFTIILKVLLGCLESHRGSLQPVGLPARDLNFTFCRESPTRTPGVQL